MSFWFATTMLAIESQRVMGLRLIKLINGGNAARTEAELMVNEKVAAMIEAGVTLATGGTMHAVVERYREHVDANSARLLA